VFTKKVIRYVSNGVVIRTFSFIKLKISWRIPSSNSSCEDDAVLYDYLGMGDFVLAILYILFHHKLGIIL
jgi:hypothetical protein